MGVISDIGPVTAAMVQAVTEALEAAGLTAFLDPSLLVFGPKDSSQIFVDAIGRIGSAPRPNTCAYVGEDRNERSFAIQAGMASFAPEFVFT